MHFFAKKESCPKVINNFPEIGEKVTEGGKKVIPKNPELSSCCHETSLKPVLFSLKCEKW
jgi:hypothetical protein